MMIVAPEKQEGCKLTYYEYNNFLYIHGSASWSHVRCTIEKSSGRYVYMAQVMR